MALRLRVAGVRAATIPTKPRGFRPRPIDESGGDEFPGGTELKGRGQESAKKVLKDSEVPGPGRPDRRVDRAKRL